MFLIYHTCIPTAARLLYFCQYASCDKLAYSLKTKELFTLFLALQFIQYLLKPVIECDKNGKVVQQSMFDTHKKLDQIFCNKIQKLINQLYQKQIEDLFHLLIVPFSVSLHETNVINKCVIFAIWLYRLSNKLPLLAIQNF